MNHSSEKLSSVPFTRFISPLAAQRLYGLFGVAALFLLIGLVDSLTGGQGVVQWGLRPELLETEPWRLMTWCLAQEGSVQASANAIGLGVGLTMAARCAGQWAAWSGLIGSILLPALWASRDMETGATLYGASTALYGALGMGLVAWRKLRLELTYTQKQDWISGFAVLGIVAFTLAIPRLLDTPARGIHIIAFCWGAALVMFWPRD